MISLVTQPRSTQLTTVARLNDELGIAVGDESYDSLLDRLISEASSEVASILGRPLWRAQFRETREGFPYEVEPTGLPGVAPFTKMVLSRVPVVSLESVTYQGEAIDLAEFSIANGEGGILYRAAGFPTTGVPDEWVFVYTAGYFLAGDNLASATLSALASDDSYNDSQSGFHPLLRAGDLIYAAAFGSAQNNGQKLVEAATASKIEVGGSLVDEPASADPKILNIENLPAVFSRAAATLAKAQFKARSRDPAIKSKSIDDVSTSYFEGGTAAASEAVRADIERYVLPL